MRASGLAACASLVPVLQVNSGRPPGLDRSATDAQPFQVQVRRPARARGLRCPRVRGARLGHHRLGRGHRGQHRRLFVKLGVPLTGSTPANTVGNDNFQSPNLFGFDESQNILLASALSMDVGGSVAAGTQVASHYIFFDPLQTGHVICTVDFDSDVTYLNPGNRGLEAGDSVTISGVRQINFDTFASSPGDYVRVITAFSPGATVPEPVSVALVLTALAGAGIARRRRG